MADPSTPPREQRWAHRTRSSMKKLLAWVVIVGLATLALVLASERNAHSYRLVNVDGTLVVKKGVTFPVGSLPWTPPDPRLAPAYAPIAPPPGAALPEEQRFSGREELDQAIFELLARWAREDVGSEKRDRLARAIGYLARADLLPGLSAAQRQELERLRAEAGYFEGRDLVGRAADELRDARERLGRTARSPSAHAGDASEAVRALDDALDAVHRAARALGPVGQEGGAAGPAGAAPAPDASPAAAPSAATPGPAATPGAGTGPGAATSPGAAGTGPAPQAPAPPGGPPR